MAANLRTQSLLGLVLVVAIGVVASVGYVGQRVGLSQMRRQGLRSSVAVAAAQAGHLSAMRWLVGHGADVNAVDRERQTPLSWAVSTGEAQDVRFLVARGADVHHRDASGRTPLVRAAYRGDRSIVAALLQAGASVNSAGDVTPLGAAVESGNAEAMHVLLKHGADPNGRHRGWTPLMVCAVFERSELVLPLHAAGARTDLRDRSGRTASMLAGDPKTASVLRDLERN